MLDKRIEKEAVRDNMLDELVAEELDKIHIDNEAASEMMFEVDTTTLDINSQC